MSNFKPRPELPTTPRSREEILDVLNDPKIVTVTEYTATAHKMCLEVLLDIREMLMPLAHPVMTVERVDLSELTGLFRTPTGDIKTTADTSPTGKYCDEYGSYDHTTKEH